MATINDLPSEQRPREKLVSHGANSLSDAELVAIFLRTGVQGCSAIEVARNLIQKHGSLAQLGRLEPKEIAREKGLGLAKASQLLACFELGARVAREQLQSQKLDSPEITAEFLRPILGHRRTETLLVLAVDRKLNLIKYEEISQGDVSSTIAHPRDILRPVILHQAEGFFLAHNHPSGDPTPSAADHKITQRVAEAAKLMNISFHDHLIIGQSSARHKAYYSFNELGKI